MTTNRPDPLTTSGKDPLTPEQRRLNMSRVRGKDTKPEMLIRRALHAAGLRYRLHVAALPGKPDLVFPRRRAVVFVHGCFWHGHDCPLFRLPGTRQDFWRAKIARNQERDLEVTSKLAASGWRILNIWECSIRGSARLPLPDVVEAARSFIAGNDATLEIEGR